MRVFKIFLLLFLASKAALAQDKLPQNKPLIVASINPLEQIILAITKDKSNNVLLIDSRNSEHEYSLKKSDIVALNKADLIFYISADLERKLAVAINANEKNKHAFELVKLSNLKLFPDRNNLKKTDPHIWLNPQNAVKIAEFVAQKVAEVDAKNADYYYKNLAEFKKEVHSAEKLIRVQLSKINGSQYLFFHDGYQYFEDYFGIKPMKIITAGHDSELSIADAKEIDLLVRQGAIKCIIGEKWDEKNTAQKLAKNYKVNFSNFDVSEVQVGYVEMLQALVRTVVGCGEVRS